MCVSDRFAVYCGSDLHDMNRMVDFASRHLYRRRRRRRRPRWQVLSLYMLFSACCHFFSPRDGQREEGWRATVCVCVCV